MNKSYKQLRGGVRKYSKIAFLSLFTLPFIFSACKASVDPIAELPLITDISSDCTTTRNSQINISVTAQVSDNGQLNYQWYKASDKLSEGILIEDAEDSAVSPATSQSGSSYYYCLITNCLGKSSQSIESPRILVTILEGIEAKAPVIISQPVNVSGKIDESFSLSVGAASKDEGSLSFQWYYSAKEDGEYTAIENANSDKLSGTISLENLGYYYCTITNTIEDNGDGAAKSASITTNKVILSDTVVNANLPVITSQPLGSCEIIPSEHTFSVGAYSPDGGQLSYQWYSIAESSDAETILIENATEEKFTASSSVKNKVAYYCVITNTIPDNGDGGIKSASITSEKAWFETINDEDIKPNFIKQPTSLNIASYIKSVPISCKVEINAKLIPISYQWYETFDGTTNLQTPLENQNESTFSVPNYFEKGIHYYYCVATSVLSNRDRYSSHTISTASDIISVAYTGLPTVIITTPNEETISSKVNWLEKASISIKGAENPSWNFESLSTSIRGRGNSTWNNPKKPYALKLDKKHSLCGMPAHKRWVLIANYLDNSFIRNEMAFYLSKEFDLDYTVDGKFVDLILNGEYKGLYWLGEAIKVDENRININDGNENIKDDEDKDYLLEMDVYYDEPVKFKSSIKQMPYMVKNDDYMIDEDTNQISTGGQARLERLQNKISYLETLLYPEGASAPNEAYNEILDIDSWIKFWMINEIMNNGELGHPKICYFTYEMANDDNPRDVFKAGPVWDFDWALLYQSSSCHLQNVIYYDALFKSETFVTRTKELWELFKDEIDTDSNVEELRNQINIAAEYDAKKWGVNHNPGDLVFENFDGHIDFVKSAIKSKIDIVDTAINNL